MKTCKNTKCENINPQNLDNFYTFKQKGNIKHHAICKECFKKRISAYRTPEYQRIQNKKYSENNKDKIKEERKLYYTKNRKKIQKTRSLQRQLPENKQKQKIRNKKYYELNKERLKLDAVKYRKCNPEKINALSAWKRARKKERTPRWLTEEHKIKIQKFYKEALFLTQETGILHHVDHIVPLCGDNVSGLHVPWNLRVITAKENMQKHNKF